MVAALPLAVLTFAERQSVIRCPFLPQNKQRLLSIRYCHSFAVSLPWESSLPLRSGFVVFGVFSRTAGREDFASDCPFCCWMELFPEFELDWLGVLDGVVLGLVLPSREL